MDLLQQLHQDRAVTVILVTHDPNVAARAERRVELSDGRVGGAG